jgi:hypothetical protein
LSVSEIRDRLSKLHHFPPSFTTLNPGYMLTKDRHFHSPERPTRMAVLEASRRLDDLVRLVRPRRAIEHVSGGEVDRPVAEDCARVTATRAEI